MRKTEIDLIILTNWYFTICKLNKPLCPKTEMVRKYLFSKVSMALTSDSSINNSIENRLLSKAFVILVILILT